MRKLFKKDLKFIVFCLCQNLFFQMMWKLVYLAMLSLYTLFTSDTFPLFKFIVPLIFKFLLISSTPYIIGVASIYFKREKLNQFNSIQFKSNQIKSWCLFIPKEKIQWNQFIMYIGQQLLLPQASWGIVICIVWLYK